ncbi:MAG TPA: hypothetical protein VM871_03360, partial [Flavisolibacter sp.]|nr:hypothetical protein [Flavisolibacter sp.]
NLGGTKSEVILGLAGLLFPLLCIFLVIKYLAPSFNRKVALMTSATSGDSEIKKGKPVGQKNYVSFWSRLLTNSKAEKGSFEFTWKMTARSRDFKLKVYPSIGYLLVYVVVVVLNNKRINLSELGQNETQSKVLIISALYFMSFLLTTAISQMVYSDKFKAAWLFYTGPLHKPGEIVSGAAKAVVMKFYVPIVVLITTAGLLLSGAAVLPNIILGLFNQVLISALRVYIGHKYFPFSMHQSNAVKTGAFLRGLGALFLSGLIAVGHYLLYSILPAIILCAVLSIVATWLLFDAIKKTGWQQIMSRYAEE